MSPLRDALQELPDAVFGDLLESDDAYLLVLDVPGVTADTTEVRAEGGRLVIDARRRKSVPPEFQYRREDRPLFIDAELPLPRDVDSEDATAEIDNGVLEIRLPKATDSDGQPIPIDDAAA
ncbi:Hsp20/alpha crystallin family protein [Halonotius terrestris]|uniref:Hsp20/alpha crystallin family protein n=1 Tax=Halonotius terrestris TaxID=2487750 RepID=A0A8J8PCC2_9EURY|nr:Hsp20/alpha crystallin family protein [Halonotius terrestris]TQQ81223.1 Hsp20/alpha crystallin family protein [Halonotius terrestris]